MPGRLAGRRVHEGQHVGGVHGQPVLAERPGQLPGRLERRHRGGGVAARAQQPAPLEAGPDADAILGRVVGVDPVEDRVALVEPVLEPERPRQLGTRLVGRHGVAVGLGGFDRHAEARLGGGRVVEVPEVVERGHPRMLAGRS